MGTIFSVITIASNGDLSPTRRSFVCLFVLVPRGVIHCLYASTLQGYGKIKLGYKARIKLTSYPYQEYNYLPATVGRLALISNNETQYRVVLQIDKGFINTYEKALAFKLEIDGWAGISTEDISLLQRIVNKLLGPSQSHEY